MAPFQQQRQRKLSSTKNESKNHAKSRKKSFKNQLRDVQRLLRQEDIPATVRVAQERMLNMLKDNMKESERQQKEKKIVKKYKMVKFFEKRKISRLYKSCKSDLTQCTDQKQRNELEEKLELLREQWNYITYFPKDEKYISLFPPTPSTNQQTTDRQEVIFKLINEKVTKGDLSDASSTILQSPKEKKKTMSKANKGIRLNQDVKEEQDGDIQDNNQNTSSLSDDHFFIDTKPYNPDESKIGAEISTTLTSHQHKVKRLKDEREIVASKKNKKNKKKQDL